MKTPLLLLLAAAAFGSSCSSAFRTRQTPDDVYYSPARQRGEYVNYATSEQQNTYGYNNPSIQSGYLDYSGIYPNCWYRGIYPMYMPLGFNIYDPEYLLYTPLEAGIIMNPYNYTSFDYYGAISATYPYYPYYYSQENGIYFAFAHPFDHYTGSTPGSYIGPRRTNLGAYGAFDPSIIQQPASLNPPPAPIRTVETATAAPRRPQSFFRRIFTPTQTNYPAGNTYNNNSVHTRTFQNNNYVPQNNNYSPSTNTRNFNQPTQTYQPPVQTNYGGGGSSSSGSAPVRTFRR